MNTLIWLYQFIGAVFLGFMIRSAMEPEVGTRESEWIIIVGLAIVWPYAFWLIYKQQVKK